VKKATEGILSSFQTNDSYTSSAVAPNQPSTGPLNPQTQSPSIRREGKVFYATILRS